MKICYVSHRYYPYPGGTEYYVQNLAEETLRQGHDVTVLTQFHKGDQNGVKVVSDPHILVREQFDLVVVHGSGVAMQDHVLGMSVASPVMFMIIRPENAPQIFPAMNNANFIACSTPTDWRFVKKYRQEHKAVQVNHSISPDEEVSDRFDNASSYVVSVGGFWSHKGHKELSEAWRLRKNLIMTGYHKDPAAFPDVNATAWQSVYMIEDKKDVLSAIKNADLLIVNSKYEGFGLTLLEAMWLGTPWASTPVAGAEVLSDYGFIYNNLDELQDWIAKNDWVEDNGQTEFKTGLSTKVHPDAKDFVRENHLTQKTVEQILSVVK